MLLKEDQPLIDALIQSRELLSEYRNMVCDYSAPERFISNRPAWDTLTRIIGKLYTVIEHFEKPKEHMRQDIFEFMDKNVGDYDGDEENSFDLARFKKDLNDFLDHRENWELIRERCYSGESRYYYVKRKER
jgi:hypothetical protein